MRQVIRKAIRDRVYQGIVKIFEYDTGDVLLTEQEIEKALRSGAINVEEVVKMFKEELVKYLGS